MCQHLNESDSTNEFLHYVIDLKDRRIYELEAEAEKLKAEVEQLKEYKWMYEDLCR